MCSRTRPRSSPFSPCECENYACIFLSPRIPRTIRLTLRRHPITLLPDANEANRSRRHRHHRLFCRTLLLGLYFRRRSGKSTDDYFVCGRQVSWWLAGTSMVATTFAADTPLAVTGLVYAQGISGNWLWWSFLPSGMMTVFLFARMWRRSGLMTDVQFAEMRYAGKPAAFLRGFRASISAC